MSEIPTRKGFFVARDLEIEDRDLAEKVAAYIDDEVQDWKRRNYGEGVIGCHACGAEIFLP